MVEVPDLVGKTEEEAKALVEAVNLGKQMVGEEASDQEKGRISSQDIPAGTKVEAYTTLKYYISKGQEELTIPEYDETVTAYAYQKSLEDMGLTVNVQKEYSADTDDTDGMEWPDVEPGYVIAVSPEAGSVAKSGDTVTLTVSRGLDWGEGALVPSVVGKTEEEAVTEFGKWLEINITKQQSADVPAGQVISQSPEAEETADPDEPASLVVSSGDQPPEAEPAADSSGAQTSAEHICSAAGSGKRRSMEMYTESEYASGLQGRRTASGTDPGSKRRIRGNYSCRRRDSYLPLQTGYYRKPGGKRGNSFCIRNDQWRISAAWNLSSYF